tara:strand:- start:27 stop:1100 length:1074 start_codon:yes stop_codon:yes gene_type:complete
MGYRSHGFFALPTKYVPELERRIKEAEINWMLKDDGEVDWSNFDEREEIPAENGAPEMTKFSYNSWKWYSGYDVPMIVERILSEIGQGETYASPEDVDTFKDVTVVYEYRFINYRDKEVMGSAVYHEEEPVAFVRVGEEFGDVDLMTNWYDMYQTTYVSNHPVTEDAPSTTVALQVTHPNKALVEKYLADYIEMATKVLNKSMSINDKFVEPDTIQGPTMTEPRRYNPKTQQYDKKNIWQGEVFFAWTTDIAIYNKNRKDLMEAVEKIEKWIVKDSRTTLFTQGPFEEYTHTNRDGTVDIRKNRLSDLLFGAWSFFEDSEPATYHGNAPNESAEIDYEPVDYWDWDIYPSSDYYSSI